MVSCEYKVTSVSSYAPAGPKKRILMRDGSDFSSYKAKKFANDGNFCAEIFLRKDV